MSGACNSGKFIRSAGLPLRRYLGSALYSRARRLPALLPGTDSAKALEARRRHLAASRRAEPLHRLRYLDLTTFLPCLNLACADRASTPASVEVQVPLLDHRPVESTAALAGDLLIRGRRQMYILNQVATRSLRAAIVKRPNAGFSTPVPRPGFPGLAREARRQPAHMRVRTSRPW